MDFSKKNFDTRVVGKIIYGMERFEYISKCIHIVGWIRALSRDDDIKLVAVNNREEKELSLELVNRGDVEYRLQEKGRVIGFESNNFMPVYSSTQFYLIYKKQRILLYNFKISKFNVINEWIRKINIRNIKTFIHAVLSGNAASLIKDVTGKGAVYAVQLKQKAEETTNVKVEEVAVGSEINWEKYNVDIIAFVHALDQIEKIKSFLQEVKKTKICYTLTGIINLNHQGKNEINSLFQKVNFYETTEELVKVVRKELFEKKRYVVVIDSNVLVPEYWLERLIMPFICKNNIAVSAPFINLAGTNNFFNVMSDALYREGYFQKFDDIFKKIEPIYEEIPSVNPGCFSVNMKYVNEQMQSDVNYDYLEHAISDWCQGISDNGLLSVVQVENLYVHYREKYEIKDKKRYFLDIRKLEKTYPSYNEKLFGYWNSQAKERVKRKIMTKILSRTLDDKINLIFNHTLGGGAEEYLKNKINQEKAFGKSNIIIRYEQGKKRYGLEYLMYGCSDTVYIEKIDDVEELFLYLDIEKIYINELCGYDNLYIVMKKILEWKKKYNKELVMLFHDYYPICPTINLLDFEGNYCNVPDIEKCQKCFEKFNFSTDIKIGDMREWRINWKKFLEECDQIVAFSQSTKQYIQAIYPQIDNIEIVGHQVNYVRRVKEYIPKSNTICIGLLGRLGKHKGAFIIKEMLQLIQKKSYDVKIVLIGTADSNILKKIEDEPFYITGKYQKEKLPDLIEQQKVDIVFISSVCPETFSYTTEEAIKMGIPAACFNIGAPPERLKNYKKGLVIDDIDAEEALKKIVQFVSYLRKEKAKS